MAFTLAVYIGRWLHAGELRSMSKSGWAVVPRDPRGGVLHPRGRSSELCCACGAGERAGCLVWSSALRVARSSGLPAVFKPLARVYDVDGHACPECAGELRPVGAVLPPASVQWVLEERILPLLGTGPPGGQLWLPLAS